MDARPGKSAHHWLPTAVRFGSHGVVWTMVLVPTLVDMADGWRPVRDDAMISIGSYRVFSTHSPLVGVWSQASQGMHHTFFDLGPLLFWLLAVPVRVDPSQGALLGAALLCGGALTVAVEAAWSVKGWPAAAAIALVVADVGWRTQLYTDLVWNPHFGLVFLIAAGATAWAVASGRFGWWPLTVLFASVAAQCHLVYAVTAVAVALVAPVAGLAYGHRPRRNRWFVVGALTGAACWTPPIVQEFLGHPGNLSLVVDSGTGRHAAGLGFGLHALATAASPGPIWLTGYPYSIALANGIPRYVSHHASIWAVVAVCVPAAVALATRQSWRELSALAVLGVVVATGTVVSFATFPEDDLAPVAYLVDVLWVVGMLIWVIVLWAGATMAMAGLRHRQGGDPHVPLPVPLRRALEAIGFLLLVIAGVAGLRAVIPAAHAQAEAVRSDAPLDHAISRSVERSVPPGPVIVVVRPATFGPRYGYYNIDYWGVALELLQGGWQPGIENSFYGAAGHLSVPPRARWPEVVVRVAPSTKTVIGVERKEPKGPG
jgi:hypothetical protein